MASGIYKRTMHSVPTGDREEKRAEAPPPAPPPSTTETDKRDGTLANPLIGTRTIYVDRRVAGHAHSRSKSKQIRRLKALIAVLILALIVISMGWILEWARLQNEVSRRAELDADLRKLEAKLEETQAALDEREKHLLDLVENRIPGLERISYNKLLDVNDKYVLSITFSETGAGEDKKLEYHAMLVNNGAEMVVPKVKIYVFNEFGLQTGVTELSKEQATSDVALAELEPGETRSYHSAVAVERDDEAIYYMIYVE